MARPYPAGDYDTVFVNVPASYQQGAIGDGEEPPHGMLRVIQHARQQGYNVGILDAHRLKLLPEEIAEQIAKTGAKSVAMNPTSLNVPEAMEIARMCDERNIPFILGGIHATLDAAQAREDFPNAFAIVKGDGETAIEEVLNAIHHGGERSYGNGIYYREHIHNGRSDRTPQMDVTKVPLIPQAELVEEPVYRHTVMVGGKEKVIDESTIFASTGCPFACRFCSSPIMVARDVRGYKPYTRPGMDRIVDEVHYAVNTMGANAIHFLDDMAFVTAEHVHDLYKGVSDRNLTGKFIWRGLTRAQVIERFDERTMEELKASGVWKMALGVESGNDAILKMIKKQVSVGQVEAAVQKLASKGIAVKGFFIMGFPGETERQILDTYELLMRLKDMGMTEASIFQFKPYPGTELYDMVLTQQPGIQEKLHYLNGRRQRTVSNDLYGKAHQRAATTVWLPDDLRIADVPSGTVREHVMRALQDFYGDTPQDESVNSECV